MWYKPDLKFQQIATIYGYSNLKYELFNFEISGNSNSQIKKVYENPKIAKIPKCQNHQKYVGISFYFYEENLNNSLMKICARRRNVQQQNHFTGRHD